MASGAHVLQQQKGSLETRIKLLINNDLKEICKAYGYQVSGKKDALQKRCIEILQDIVNRGDETGFQDMNYRVSHHGAAPPRSSNIATSSNSNQNGTYNNYSQMTGRANVNGRPWSGKNFKSSPFYEVLDTVVALHDLPAGPEMPQNRHTVKATLVLSPEHVMRLKSDATMRLLLYCGMSQGMSPHHPADVAFPNQLEVKINGDDVKANFKGLKNKPGSTKPADITDKVRKANNYPNQLTVTYALTTKRYAFVVHLVKHISAETLTDRIKATQHGGGIITKQSVLNEMNRANADSDIAATSTRMSLKDPISTLPITLPVRSVVCKHNQCFDGAMFMALQDQAPQWSCPVCSKPVTYEQLSVDKYFEEILQEAKRLGRSVEKVDIEPDGQYTFPNEDEETQPPGHSSKGGRAAYDNDFDDDLVEVQDSPSRPAVNAVPTPNTTSSVFSPAPTAGFAMNTPPLSSRGASTAPSISSTVQSNKRPASSVIDLTLSDDEDEPPRPAKRHLPSMQSSISTSYHTPSSLPSSRHPSRSTGHGQVTDSYRPSSNTSRPAVNGTSSSYSGFANAGNTSLASASPFARGNSNSPAYATFGNVSSPQPQHSSNTWGTAPARPSAGSNGTAPSFQSFPMRPPLPSISPAAQSSGPGVRLPSLSSMQTPLPEGFGGTWRNRYGNYSQSPPS